MSDVQCRLPSSTHTINLQQAQVICFACDGLQSRCHFFRSLNVWKRLCKWEVRNLKSQLDDKRYGKYVNQMENQQINYDF